MRCSKAEQQDRSEREFKDRWTHELLDSAADEVVPFDDLSAIICHQTMMKSKLEDDIDALFRLPLAEFTGERNTLSARLKKEGRRNDADRVKLLAKPSVSAWAV